MKDLYLDCFSGVAGDMLVGALLDLGAPFEAVRDGLAKLGVSGDRLERRTVVRHAIAATKFEVVLDGHEHADPGAFAHPAGSGHEHSHADGHTHSHPHDHGHAHDHDHETPHAHGAARGLREIRALLTAADLPLRVRDRALASFSLLAAAEGRVHGMPPEDVHFHEVGAVDAICDIVGTCLALEALDVDRIFVGPLRTGSGFVKCAHGTMPIPAPGALNCLDGFDVRFEQGRGELVTPTGACLVGALAKSGAPAGFVVERTGYGAGTRDPADAPNVLRAVLGRAESPEESVIEISTNLDHVAPTQIAVAMDAAFAAGALDVFVVPCTMKKGRPAHLFVALATDGTRAAVERAIFRETGTLGVRRTRTDRTVLARSFATVVTPWGDVRVKIGTHCGETTSRVPEFEDCRALAARAGVAVAAVLDAARAACENGTR
ncbi:MAG: nickel pincer cofactor biosynthesis protein LarC [Planctomycetes bacterium]|nr:nickel pincer cofactor biosynthesis protein LarC [Planctomycetota bacterium]